MSRSRIVVVLALVLTLGIIAGTFTTAASPTLTVAPAPVPQTGQRTSYLPGKGNDGELQIGIEWDAATRFTDNGDGTVLDNLTGLIWLRDRDAECSFFGVKGWAQAFKDTAALADGKCGLTDGSGYEDWRLPNVREMQSLIDYGEGKLALPDGYRDFFDFRPDTRFYWTSTSFSPKRPDIYAWTVDLVIGQVTHVLKSNANYVWPVRGEGITAFYQYMPLAVVEDGP